MKPTPLHPCDTAQASMLHDANACKDRGTELFMKEKYELAAAEYFDGIMILVKGQRGADILDLVTTLRSNRSACFLQLARTSCSGPAQIISWAREAARDATAVLDMPKHASPVLLLKARLRRASATGIILQHEGSDVEATIEQTSADAAQVLHSPLASGDQKKQARELQEPIRLQHAKALYIGGLPDARTARAANGAPRGVHRRANAQDRQVFHGQTWTCEHGRWHAQGWRGERCGIQDA